MDKYPVVTGESKTLQLVLSGRSLARYGDGEINLARGRAIPCQRHSQRLQERLYGILQDANECLIGIPNIRSATPKAPFWSKYLTIVPPLLADRAYVSSFVSRPDSAPWIDTALYWEALTSLWVGRDVTLVRGSVRSLVAADLVGARRVTEIIGPLKDAWSDYDALLAAIGQPARALLCLGPTATVLAVDLCAKGVHAIDVGHVGMYLRKHRLGEPMRVTEADKALGLQAV